MPMLTEYQVAPGEGLELDMTFDQDVATWDVTAKLYCPSLTGYTPATCVVTTTSSSATRRVRVKGVDTAAIAARGGVVEAVAVDPANASVPVVRRVAIRVLPALA